MHVCVILHAWGGHGCFRAARKGGRNLSESMSYFCMLAHFESAWAKTQNPIHKLDSICHKSCCRLGRDI